MFAVIAIALLAIYLCASLALDFYRTFSITRTLRKVFAQHLKDMAAARATDPWYPGHPVAGSGLDVDMIDGISSENIKYCAAPAA